MSGLNHKTNPGANGMPHPRLVRLKPAAEYLSLSQWTLRRLVQEGQIPIVKTHDNAPWLVDIKDLDSWIERTKTSLADFP
jgi:excisionase family DNA binding protein